ETAVLFPLALSAYALFHWMRSARQTGEPRSLLAAVSPAFSAIPLICWYAYHYRKTGFIFGNPEFFRYNVQATMNPLRIAIALALRLWQVFGYLNLFVLSGAVLIVLLCNTTSREKVDGALSQARIVGALAATSACYVVAMGILGGAVLARYMLPVTPLV